MKERSLLRDKGGTAGIDVHDLNPASRHSDSIIMMQQEETVAAVLLARFLLRRISQKSMGLKLE